jgi:hypothetical protein
VKTVVIDTAKAKVTLSPEARALIVRQLGVALADAWRHQQRTTEPESTERAS